MSNVKIPILQGNILIEKPKFGECKKSELIGDLSEKNHSDWFAGCRKELFFKGTIFVDKYRINSYG